MQTDSELMSLNRIVTISRDPEVQRLAHRCSHEVFGADDPTDALEVIQTVNPNLILFDHRYNANFVREFIDTVDKNSIDIPVVLVGYSDCGGTEFSTEFTQLGIYDYIQGMQDYERLQRIISRIKNESNEDGCNQQDSYKDEDYFFANEFAVTISMAGKSRAIINTLKMIKIIAPKVL